MSRSRWFLLHLGSTLPRPVKGLLLGFLCALLMWSVQNLDVPQAMERAMLDTLFRIRGPQASSPNVIILEVDNATVSRAEGWPLPRHVYADVIRWLHHAGAKTIAFDVIFSTDAPKPEDDKALEQACREAGNVVHAVVFNLQESINLTESTNTPAKSKVQRMPARFALTDRGVHCRYAISAMITKEPLLQSAAGLGYVTVVPEWDGALRRIPNVIRFRQFNLYPSLALATAAHYLDVKPNDIIASNRGNGGELYLARRHVPIDTNGETLVNWLGVQTIPSYSFNDIFDNGHKPDFAAIFKDKVVVIGVTAAGAYEQHATPFSPNQPAVELQANALDNILSNRLLREAPSTLPLAILFLFPCLLGTLIAESNAKVSGLVTLGFTVLIWTAAALLLAYDNLYVPVASPLLAGVLTCAVTVGRREIREALALRVAEERYALAVRGANDGLWDWNLQSNEIYYSPRWKAMLGYNDDEIGNSPEEWFKRIHPEDARRVRAELKQHLDGESPHFESEYRIFHKDGNIRWMLCRGLQVPGKAGQAARMAGSQTDITGRKEAEAKLVHNAFYDSLTGLPNRALFMNHLEQAIGRAKRRPDYLFAVLFLDLDRFKNVNDSLGHTKGDELLKQVAQRVSECLRPGDTPARLGGDEFTLLLDDIHDVSDATRVADRFQRELAKPYELNGTEVFTNVSIGIALSTTHYDYPEDVIRDADTAMYRAKALGTGQHQVFDAAMHAHAVALLRLETDLRRALERQNFHVYYQAIVSLETGHIAGFEALARWQHPTRGLVPPGEFIAIAEDTGIIISIDHWVLREACRQTHAWQERYGFNPPLTISANLSSKQFAQADLVSQLERIIGSTDFNPGNLKLEITEGVIMQNTEAAAEMLLEMKKLGLQLSIDDFGTGYSSLSYLHQFPLDNLKIDRSFVNRIGPNGENSEIVRAIVTLAKNLGMKVIAEGVETADQLAQLRLLGCEYGQGYYFSKPITGEEAANLLAKNPQW
ncbi:MAG: EAL domain-containing protein [Abitibacteriaceae bacterium]|nr:EAL domain-containing protein [Abditibacteriaceae bacterium]